MEKIICIDFDNTITKIDTGNKLFHNFSREPSITDDYVNQYRNGNITLPHLYQMELFYMKTDKEKLEEFVDNVEVDDHFKGFVEKYRDRYDMIILSDGFSWYIKRILNRIGVKDIDVLSNEMIFEENRVFINFPYMDNECFQCGNCKRNHIRRFRDRYNGIIYIGDGISDFCAAKESDRVFAKRGTFLHNKIENGELEGRIFNDFSEIEL